MSRTEHRPFVWERVLGGVSLLSGAAVLLSGLPLVVIGPAFGTVLLIGALACAARLIPARNTFTTVGLATFALLLLLPATGWAVAASSDFLLVVGVALALFGIVKIT